MDRAGAAEAGLLGMNPLDLPPTPFLEFYGAIAIGALLALFWLRWNVGVAQSAAGLSGFGALHVAYVVGGRQRAFDTALVSLFEAGAMSPGGTARTIRVDRATAAPWDLLPVFADMSGVTDRRVLSASFEPLVMRLRDELVGRGLIPASSEARRFRLFAWLILAIPLVVGVAGVGVALQRGQPVGVLVGAVAATLVIGSLMTRKVLRSRAGSAALRRMKRAPLPNEMPLAFALSGCAVLAGRSYQSFFHPGNQ